MAYLVEISPRGNERDVILFLRENDRSFSERIRLDHVIPTSRLGYGDMVRLMDYLKRAKNPALEAYQPGLEGVIFNQMLYCGKTLDTSGLDKYEMEWQVSKGKWVVHAIGPRNMKKALPKSFVTDKVRNNIALMCRLQLGYPFAEYPAGALEYPYAFQRVMDLESVEKTILEIMSQKMMACDIEVRNAPVYDDIFSVQLFTGDRSFGNFIITTDRTQRGTFSIETPFGEQEFTVLNAKGMAELGILASDLIISYDPLFLVGSNISGYDMVKLTELTGTFTPGVGYKSGKKTVHVKPKIKVSKSVMGLFPVVSVDGRIIIDTAAFGQHKLQLTPDNKQATVLEELTGLHLEKETKGDYGLLEQKAQMSKNGDWAATMWILRYGANDVIRDVLSGRRILETLVPASLALGVGMTSLCSTSMHSVAESSYDGIYFKRTHTYPRTALKSEAEFKEFVPSEITEGLFSGSWATARGRFREATVLRLSPYITAFEIAVKSNPALDPLYKMYLHSDDPYIRCAACLDLETYFLKALYHLRAASRSHSLLLTGCAAEDAVTPTRETDWYFKRLFLGEGFYKWKTKKMNTTEIKRLITENVRRIREALNEMTPLNIHGNYLLVSGRPDIGAYSDGIIDAGTGMAISCTRGKFVAFINGVPKQQGFDFNARKGSRCDYEKDLMKEIMSSIRADNGDILEIAKGAISMIRREPEESLRKKLSFNVKARRDYDRFSDPARRQERVRVQIAAGTMKEEKINYGYAVGSREPVRNEEWAGAQIDRERYIQTMFGFIDNKGNHWGHVGEILYSYCLGEGRADRRRLAALLQKMFSGKTSGAEEEWIRGTPRQLSLF